MSTIKILSVNISEKKGTIKKPVPAITLDEQGVQQDAHAGFWHRQVSLLGKDSIDKFSAEAKRTINFGEFAENLTTEGVTLYKTHPLDRFMNDTVELEVTQIGKKCHGDNCAIFREVGNCVMPKEGIFARVIRKGEVKAGDDLKYVPKVYKVLVITLSDRASAGIYEDRSGPRVKELCEEYFKEQGWENKITNIVIPDKAETLKSLLEESIQREDDIIITTGGTGIGPRDITPEVVRSIMDKEIPGIMDLIRMKYGQEKPNALLSRSVAGVAGKTLIYALPGSVKAVNEYMAEIHRSLRHTIYMLHGLDLH